MSPKKWFYLLSFLLLTAIGLFIWKTNGLNLPAPTGIYGVGTTFISLIDSSRVEHHDPSEKRELVVQVWYPADQKKYQQNPMPYLGKAVEHVKRAIAEIKAIPIEQLKYVNALTTHSYANIACSHKESSYPVIIFSPGFGAPQETYSMILQDLASHGYIVFGINHPYVSDPTIFPDGRIILPDPLLKKIDSDESRKRVGAEFQVWLQDINFLIEQLPKINAEHQILHDAINLQQIAIMGHSFGGRAALEIGRSNPLVTCGVDLDGKLNPDTSMVGILKPFLFMVAERKDTTALEQILTLKRASGPDVSVLVLKGAEHQTFSDLNYVFKKWFHTSGLEPLRGIEIIQKLLIAFFDSYLKNKKNGFLDQVSKIGDEVIV